MKQKILGWQLYKL